MNYLAHLHLAEPTPESCLGNLLGDFVKGYPWDDRYPEAVWRGIVEHRFVDAYTDRHPRWKRSREILPVELRRFAGIVVDIYYDYFLHRHWDRFSPEEKLEAFVERVTGDLWTARDLAPPVARGAIGKMIKQGWLYEYASLDGIDRTLVRVRSRAPYLEPVFAASGRLRDRLPELEEDFLAFYPDLIAYVEAMRDGCGMGGPAHASGVTRSVGGMGVPPMRRVRARTADGSSRPVSGPFPAADAKPGDAGPKPCDSA